jgi:hypothetical protein
MKTRLVASTHPHRIDGEGVAHCATFNSSVTPKGLLTHSTGVGKSEVPWRLIAGSVSRTACGVHAEGAWTGAVLALAHRGVTHVRGKDCVNPDIGLAIVTMISFPAERDGQRARMPVP